MNFAKNLLGKYGWKEGDGLGKNNDGICKPLKAAYKFNKSGLGHNQADDMNNHWWENVFNAAADNMNVTKDEDGVVSMERKTDDAVEITTKNYTISTKTDKNFYKGQFLRTSTLVNSGQEVEIADKDEVVFETVKLNPFKVVTDEDMLRACEGRTVHKGARHGLKMSGKLARIEAQEREMLAKMGLTYTQPIERIVQNEWTEVKSKKRPRNYTNSVEDNVILSDSVEVTLQQSDYHSKSKKKAKKQRRLDEELAKSFATVSTSLETVKEKDINCQSIEITACSDVLESTSKSHKKKSKKGSKMSKHIPDAISDNTLNLEELSSIRKTSKRKRLASEAQVVSISATIDLTVDKKKSKKAKKNRMLADDVVFASNVDQFKKSEPIEIDSSDREGERKAAKMQRKKDRQVRRLAKEMDREMNIL